MGVNLADAPRIQHELKFGRPLTMVLVGMVVIPPLFLFSSPLSWGPDAALTVLALGFVIGAPLTVIGMRGLLRVSRTWGQVIEAIHEEWRTGNRVVPDGLVLAFPGIARWREVPALGEADVPRLERAVFLEKWAPRLLVAMFLGFVAPFILFLSLDWRGLVPVVVTSLTTFGPLAAALFLRALAGSGVTLLARLREYEKATGKRVLPETLRGTP